MVSGDACMVSPIVEPVLTGSDLIADIGRARSSGLLTAWRLGQAGVVVCLSSGALIVIDAYLSDHCEAVLPAPYDHRRATRAPLAASELAAVDLVVCTHDHLDHLDVPTIRTLGRFPGPRMVAPEASRQTLIDLGWPEDRLHLTRGGDQVDVAGLRVVAIPVPHEDFDIGEVGAPYQGYVVRDSESSFAHLGDAMDHAFVRTALRAAGTVDVLFAPINGRSPERATIGFAGNMSADEAVSLALDVPTSHTIPVHYDMFAQNVDPGAVQRFETAARAAGLPHTVLAVGEAWSPTQEQM